MMSTRSSILVGPWYAILKMVAADSGVRLESLGKSLVLNCEAGLDVGISG